MSRTDDLKRDILSRVREYARLAHDPAPFVPGRSRVTYAGRVFGEVELANLVEASLEFWLTAGPWTERFEKDLADYLGVKHCLLVNSGSSANLLAFMALTSERLRDRMIRRGDEVITVAAAFPTTVAPIVQFGAVPVFVDITLPGYNIDCSRLEAALSPRTKAVMLAHTLGNPFDLDEVVAFCRRHGLWLIEDNCDALGSEYRGKRTGSFGDIGTSSFYPPHHITTGEGGAVYTGDDILAGILLSLRDWGRDCTCPSGKDNTCGKRFSQRFGELPFGYDHKYVYSHFGYNLKATDLQASIGCAQLDMLPAFVKARRDNFQTLLAAIADLDEFFLLPQATVGSEPSWFGFILLVREDAPFSRDDIVRHLEGSRIQTRMLFAGNLLRHPCFDAMRRDRTGFRVVGDLSSTDRAMRNAFWVGVYPGLGRGQIEHICDSIRSFARGGK